MYRSGSVAEFHQHPEFINAHGGDMCEQSSAFAKKIWAELCHVNGNLGCSS